MGGCGQTPLPVPWICICHALLHQLSCDFASIWGSFLGINYAYNSFKDSVLRQKHVPPSMDPPPLAAEILELNFWRGIKFLRGEGGGANITSVHMNYYVLSEIESLHMQHAINILISSQQHQTSELGPIEALFFLQLIIVLNLDKIEAIAFHTPYIEILDSFTCSEAYTPPPPPPPPPKKKKNFFWIHSPARPQMSH